MRFVKLCVPVLLIASFCSSLSFAAVPDRIPGTIDSSQMVVIKGNLHGLAQPRFDLGRADASKMIHGVTLAFRPSATQQKDLDNLLAEQQDRSSPNYRKWLTPAQFADRFGMTRGDLKRITAWLQSQGFAVTSVANSRNEISFDGTVSQIEVVFGTEIHDYLVDGVIHFANATNPSVPAVLAGSVLAIGHLHDFAPKPRVKVQPHLTSYVSGGHYLTPGDFATIYDLQPMYTAGNTGTGQKIAVVGQSTVNTTDLNNFRSAAGLTASTVTMTLMEGTATRCAGDEGESDLDLEWSGGVAKNASIIFVYAGLGTGDTCANRVDNVWDALKYAVQNRVAPFISTSYGYCESGLGQAFALQVQGWAQQANTQGQTIAAAAGDSGAADCDPNTTDPNGTSATGGLAVDVPASIPEVTGMGGNTFSGDTAGTVTGTPPNTTAAGDAPYWGPSGTGSDTVSSALTYIPEQAWNDTVLAGSLSASGGGASIYFTKPTWQTGTGVPADGKRDVPDLSLAASPNHDGYLFCSEDGPNGTIVSTCTAGFRDSSGSFAVVGGTSAAAPTFSAILALLNESLGNTPPAGLGNVNPNLYTFAGTTPTAFHDVTTGNNIVPCTTGTPNCPATAPFQFGFTAGTGYDQVTGLGSVDAFKLAQAWGATRAPSSVTLTPSSTQVSAGASVTLTAVVTPSTATGSVTFNNGSTALGTVALSSGTAALTTTTLPVGANSITATYNGDGTLATSSSTAATVTVSPAFTLTPTAATFPVAQGSPVDATVNVALASGSTATITFTCNDPAPLSTCTVPPQTNKSGPVSFHITTTPPTIGMLQPANHGMRIFYAALLPGLLGIVFTAGSRRSLRGLRFLGLIVVLGFSTLWLASCGGSSGSTSNPGTPKGSYTITVTGTSGTTTVSSSFQLVVQ